MLRHEPPSLISIIAMLVHATDAGVTTAARRLGIGVRKGLRRKGSRLRHSRSVAVGATTRRRRWRMTLARNRKFADSPLEGTGFEISVPRYVSGLAGLRDAQSGQRRWVKSIQGLWAADASVMPRIPRSGGAHATVIMIGERVVDWTAGG